jgi:AcrR family transcriptional regulator
MARTKATKKEESHERIVAAAARAIRRTGYAGTGVADVMKDAGLTHGGFYAHFPSRDAMLAEAADRAGAETLAAMKRLETEVPQEDLLQALVESYLSKAHVQDIEKGCATAALCSEIVRQAPEVRRAATNRIKESIDLIARQLPDWGKESAHESALAIFATMVGGLVLARAVDDTKLSDELRKAVLKRLLPAKA